MFLSMLTIVLTVTLLSVGLSLFQVGRIQRQAAAQRLQDVARLLAAELEGMAQAEWGERTQSWAARLGAPQSAQDDEYRLTIIDAGGGVRFDTEAEAGALTNHGNRPEVAAALSGSEGSDIRRSDTLHRDMLYVAVPMADGSVLRMAEPVEEVDLAQQAVWGAAAVGALAGLLLALPLGALMTRGVLSPLRSMWRQARAISGGAYAARLPVGADELGGLAGDFNALADSLEQSLLEQQRAHAQLAGVLECAPFGILAVDARQRVLMGNSALRGLFGLSDGARPGVPLVEYLRNSELWEAVADTLAGRSVERTLSGERVLRLYTAPIRLQGQVQGAVVAVQDVTHVRRLEQMRTEFVSNATHELKTPLTALRGYIETLRSPLGESAAARAEMLDIMDMQGERLQLLIEDLLTLGEIEASHQPFAGEGTDAAALLETVAETLRPQAAACGVALHVEAPTARLRARAQRDRAERMLLNLVDNAIKYNRPGGQVWVSAEAAEGRVRITVRDDGIGIAPEHQARIFERFYRVDKGRSRDMGGTGLGLSIVKHLVRLFGGDLSFESAPGQGSTFVVDLPLYREGD